MVRSKDLKWNNLVPWIFRNVTTFFYGQTLQIRFYANALNLKTNYVRAGNKIKNIIRAEKVNPNDITKLAAKLFQMQM
jgi:hypothetical protein